MTKKDYILIADALFEVKDSKSKKWNDCCNSIADALSVNEKFNRNSFIHYCLNGKSNRKEAV